MNTLTDQELLRNYTASRSEAAFSELVRRNVDFVYSAALRMVHDAHTADDVTQGVFMALAENAGKLTDRPILAGWLYRTTQFLASKAIRSEVRRRAREQEAAAMIELSSAEPDAIWEQIAPTLDIVLDELDESDRDVLFLRYFQHKSAREISEVLVINEEAAKKRVSRAVERLRELFAKRGITVGATGIIVAISANAVQAAPIGLAVGISTAATIGGSTLISTSAATTTKAIAMTTLQKALITGTITICVGTALYEAHQASSLRAQIESLQVRLLAGAQSGQHNSLDPAAEVAKHVSALQVENERLKNNASELLKLRGEVATLRSDSQELAQLKTAVGKVAMDPVEIEMKSWQSRVNQIKQRLEEMPEKKIPELQFLEQKDWFEAAREAKLQKDEDFRSVFKDLRSSAKGRFASMLSGALSAYTKANDGQLPKDVSQLQAYFTLPVDDAILNRYQMLQSGSLSDARGKWLVTERVPVDIDYDTRYYVSTSGWQGGEVKDYLPDSAMARKYPPVGK